jgi:hypothetical protein
MLIVQGHPIPRTENRFAGDAIAERQLESGFNFGQVPGILGLTRALATPYANS